MSENAAAMPGSPARPVSSARHGAGVIADGLTALVATLAFVQFGLAGWGAFGGSFGVHGILGTTIGGLSILVMIATLVARPGKRNVWLAVALAVLAAPVQTVFAAVGFNVNAWFGALHALNGVVILSLSGYLTARARRRRSAG